jgi:hypothetical protein
MEFETFLKLYYKSLKMKHPSIREGQLFMNLLYEVRFDLYNLLMYTNYDVFYKDNESVSLTIDYVRDKW